MQLSDFDYELPDRLIARRPPERRDGGRLLLVGGAGPFEHRRFEELPELLAPGDLLVLNDTRVLPARLRGHKVETGGEVELLLDRPIEGSVWYALGQASKGFKVGQRLLIGRATVTVVAIEDQGRLRVDFGAVDPVGLAHRAGELPLPPYLERAPEPEDAARYQTVFAKEPGAVAAPTAGLHFTDGVLRAIRARGVETAFLTLHVGPGTFLPVRADDVESHRMLEERYEIGSALAAEFGRAKASGGRVIAVGTTVTRALESAVRDGTLSVGPALTDLFVRPGHRFRAIDGLLTNFHLPRSTLLMLVSAFAGRERVLAAYAEAVAREYRFFSYGDCCLFLLIAFALHATDGAARRGTLATPHGAVETPIFMPVGTVASVKAVGPDDLRAIGTQILLGNTYHLMLRPGPKLIQELGGLARFMAWNGPTLTDSGGFQVFSLEGRRKISEAGVEFRSHLDGSAHFLSPERSIEIQEQLGADVIMAFDECPPAGAARPDLERSLALTARWAKRCRDAWHPDAPSALFGIVQGGLDLELRRRAVDEICALDLPGYALGGYSVGETPAQMHESLPDVAPLLPTDRPRYLMGVGTPDDLLRAIEAGLDMFDCVLPTRCARNGLLFTSAGRVVIRNQRYATDPAPVDARCGCYTCKTFSRAYLRHLFQSKELLAYRLNSVHNLAYFLSLMDGAREAIAAQSFRAYAARVRAGWDESATRETIE